MKKPTSLAVFASLILASVVSVICPGNCRCVAGQGHRQRRLRHATSERPLTEIYRVGVGDVLDIRLLNSATNRSTLFTVVGTGVIDLPVVGGTVPVAGLTPEEIQKRLASELKRRAVEENAQVSVGVRQYLSHSVTITGLVVSPGTRFLRRETVPLYVVLAESPLRNDAGRITIMRGGTPGEAHDLSDPATMNLNVQAGDVITVSARPQEFYYIGGRINYPGQKSFQAGITLLQAVLAAGGTPQTGKQGRHLARERRGPSGDDALQHQADQIRRGAGSQTSARGSHRSAHD